jgi:C_GCAxxG_C_C family probable redox protein
MSRVDRAVSSFRGGLNCSQAVFSTFAADFGIDREIALKLAAAFGGGMGRTAGTCGAVTGALMILSLQHGPTEARDQEGREKVYSLVRDFVQRFASRNQTITCRELINCDISTPEGLATAREQNVFGDVCPKFVQDAAEILEEMLRERG